LTSPLQIILQKTLQFSYLAIYLLLILLFLIF